VQNLRNPVATLDNASLPVPTEPGKNFHCAVCVAPALPSTLTGRPASPAYLGLAETSPESRLPAIPASAHLSSKFRTTGASNYQSLYTPSSMWCGEKLDGMQPVCTSRASPNSGSRRASFFVLQGRFGYPDLRCWLPTQPLEAFN
jgi:hypothetical protein